MNGTPKNDEARCGAHAPQRQRAFCAADIKSGTLKAAGVVKTAPGTPATAAVNKRLFPVYSAFLFYPAFLILMLSGCATHASLQTVYYDIPPHSGNDTPLVIALISDLHSDIYGKDQTPLLNRIKEASPDIIVLAGDIFDNIAGPLGTRLLLGGIKDTGIPVFYVTGNHEYESAGFDEMMRELEDFGVTILSDTYVLLEVNGMPLLIAGVEDPDKNLRDSSYAPSYTIFNEIYAVDAYKILICHRPEIAKLYYGFDLKLSGHTHGGQIRLPPLINGLYSPGQGLFPKYSGGLYETGNGLLVVSRGLTTRRPLLPRIFNPPELVVIRLGGYNEK
ncbi:MAG: metallophosphoesterase [Spirochaetaceae bacterium]|jgi:predicted MPP superfamily phosphohydrolase|nr:metallophosphoesterase [Spirochaetaceae bacterium]